MAEKENKVLDYKPTELFEMQARLLNENELLSLQFWNVYESGIYEKNRYTMNKKQREFFDLFASRIQEIYKSLLKLVQ